MTDNTLALVGDIGGTNARFALTDLAAPQARALLVVERRQVVVADRHLARVGPDDPGEDEPDPQKDDASDDQEEEDDKYSVKRKTR